MNIIIKPRLLAIDVISHYELGNDSKMIDKIEDVFLYDENIHTYCCELVPSFDCVYLYTNLSFSTELSDDLRDKLEQRYAYEPTEDCYVHCSQAKPVYAGRDGLYTEETYEEAFEEVRECYSCNHAY